MVLRTWSAVPSPSLPLRAVHSSTRTSGGTRRTRSTPFSASCLGCQGSFCAETGGESRIRASRTIHSREFVIFASLLRPRHTIPPGGVIAADARLSAIRAIFPARFFLPATAAFHALLEEDEGSRVPFA